MTAATRRFLRLPAAALCLLLAAVLTAGAQSSAPTEGKPGLQVVVRLRADDTCQVGKTPVKPAELPLALRVLAGLPETPAILVEADKEVLYERVVTLLDACREAGLTQVAITDPDKRAGR